MSVGAAQDLASATNSAAVLLALLASPNVSSVISRVGNNGARNDAVYLSLANLAADGGTLESMLSYPAALGPATIAAAFANAHVYDNLWGGQHNTAYYIDNWYGASYAHPNSRVGEYGYMLVACNPISTTQQLLNVASIDYSNLTDTVLSYLVQHANATSDVINAALSNPRAGNLTITAAVGGANLASLQSIFANHFSFSILAAMAGNSNADTALLGDIYTACVNYIAGNPGASQTYILNTINAIAANVHTGAGVLANIWDNLTTMAAATSVAQDLTSIANSAHHTVASDNAVINNSHVQVPGAALATIAARVTDAALLATIIAKPGANTTTYRAVAANSHATQALLTTLTGLNNGFPPDSTLDANIASNANTSTACLITIAGRTIYSSAMHYITIHPNYNATSDAAVVANSSTLAADLLTIATRANDTLLGQIVHDSYGQVTVDVLNVYAMHSIENPATYAAIAGNQHVSVATASDIATNYASQTTLTALLGNSAVNNNSSVTNVIFTAGNYALLETIAGSLTSQQHVAAAQLAYFAADSGIASYHTIMTNLLANSSVNTIPDVFLEFLHNPISLGQIDITSQAYVSVLPGVAAIIPAGEVAQARLLAQYTTSAAVIVALLNNTEVNTDATVRSSIAANNNVTAGLASFIATATTGTFPVASATILATIATNQSIINALLASNVYNYVNSPVVTALNANSSVSSAPQVRQQVRASVLLANRTSLQSIATQYANSSGGALVGLRSQALAAATAAANTAADAATSDPTSASTAIATALAAVNDGAIALTADQKHTAVNAVMQAALTAATDHGIIIDDAAITNAVTLDPAALDITLQLPQVASNPVAQTTFTLAAAPVQTVQLTAFTAAFPSLAGYVTSNQAVATQAVNAAFSTANTASADAAVGAVLALPAAARNVGFSNMLAKLR